MHLIIRNAAQPLTLVGPLTTPTAAGSHLRLRASGVVALRAIESLDLRTGMQPPVRVQRYDAQAMQRDFGWFVEHLAVATWRIDQDLAADHPITIDATIAGFAPRDAGGPLQAPNPYAGLQWTWTLVSAPDADAPPDTWQPVAAPFTCHLTAGPCEQFDAIVRPGGTLAIRALDAFHNPTAPGNTILPVDGAPLPLDPDHPVTTTDCHRQRVTLTDPRGHTLVSSARPVGLDGIPVFFGEFHWHCDFSGDGQRPMADALASARDELCLDFAGPSDHLGAGISYGRRTIEDQRDICARFDDPGRFVVLPTFERSEREGHANVIAASWDTLLQVARAIDRDRFPANHFPRSEVIAACPPGRALIVPHHTNMDSFVREGVVHPADGRPFWCRYDWGPTPDHTVTRLVEIHQQRGSFEDETPDPDWRIASGGFGSSVRTALARGYRLGFTGGTDNHSGWPTRHAGGPCGLTGVHADQRTLPALFAALHARRCYATTGARIVADFHCNGRPMGSELVLEPGEPRHFRILLRGTAPFVAVQIISCGAILADLPIPPDSLDLDLTWTDDRPGRPLCDCWYYVRARQTDGHCVWLSPVWIDLPDTAPCA